MRKNKHMHILNLLFSTCHICPSNGLGIPCPHVSQYKLTKQHHNQLRFKYLGDADLSPKCITIIIIQVYPKCWFVDKISNKNIY